MIGACTPGLSVGQVLDMSGGVCEPRHKNGSMENRAAVCRLFICVKLGDSATITNGKLQHTFGDDATSKAQTFRWHKMCVLISSVTSV